MKCFKNIKTEMMKERPLGVMIIGSILIFTSFYQLYHIPQFYAYRIINHGPSEDLIKIRFVISWLLRMVGLISGIGVISLQERFRKILIGLSYFLIFTVFLRHTYSSFLFYTTPTYYQFAIKDFSLQTFTWISVAVRCSIDVSFSIVTIYYFTRPKVKGQFK